MANYFYNYLKIEGQHKDLMLFKENALPKGQFGIHSQEVLVMDSLLPILSGIDPVHIHGTRDVYETFVNMNDNYLSYDFVSNWCPPSIGFKSISEQYPDLKFILNFHSSDANCLGSHVFKNGEVILFENHSYNEFTDFEILYSNARLENKKIFIDCEVEHYQKLNIKTYHQHEFQNKQIVSHFTINIDLEALKQTSVEKKDIRIIDAPTIELSNLLHCISNDFIYSLNKLIIPVLAQEVLKNF